MKDIQDTWAKKAKNEGYRSRASYKLIQINQTHKLIEQADLIIELGSAPGGWSQVISGKKKSHAKCLAIDILSMQNVDAIDFYKIDLFSDEFAKLLNDLPKKADLILSSLKTGDKVLLLDEKGSSFGSVEFSKYLQKKMNSGIKRLVFIVGGPYGFDTSIYDKYQDKLSLSKMTFSHQMVRLFFCEQLYRAMTILKNEPYHHK